MKPAHAFNNAHFVLVLAPLFWGGNSVAGKLASLDWQPFTITALRWFLTAIVIFPFALKYLRRDFTVLRESWVILFALGGIGMSMFSLLMYLALHYTSAINVAIEQAAIPALIMLANFIVLSQRVTILQIVGLACCVVGVLITTTLGNPLSFFSDGLNHGDAIMLLACMFYAGYTFGLRWRPKIHWLSFMWVISVSAFLVTIPFTLWEWQQTGTALVSNNLLQPGIRGWAVIAYIIIFPTIVGQICYARGVELIGGNRAGLFINLVPIFGAILAVLVLGESFKTYHAIGLLMVIGGIAFAERFSEK